MTVRTNFKAVMDKVAKGVAESFKAQAMKLLGAEAIRLIVVRTRLGYGVVRPGAPRQKLKPLSKRYIEHREDSRLSGFTAPRRSNLTFTGAMLESLRIKTSKAGAVSIEPTGGRRDGQTNAAVAGHVTKGGRPFISLSDLEIKKLARYMEKEILGKTLRKRGLTK